jgi:hypothetical protein
VPAGHGFRRNDDQALLPTGPDLPGNNPEEPVEGAKSWPWMAPFQRGKLLTQGQVFEEKTSLRTKEANERSKAEPEQSEHGPKLYQNPAETMSACLFQDRPEFWRTTAVPRATAKSDPMRTSAANCFRLIVTVLMLVPIRTNGGQEA